MIVYVYSDLGHSCAPKVPLFLALMVGPLFTVILLLTTSSFCSNSCSSPSPTSTSSCSTSCCPPLQFGIYLPDCPRKVFVKDQTQPNGRKEINDEGGEEQEEQEEMTREMREKEEDFTDLEKL